MELEERVAALEAGLAELTARLARQPESVDEANDAADPFWALHQLRQRGGEADGGAVLFTGYRTGGDGAGEVQWQLGRTVDDLLGRDWESLAPVVDALAHPVRLRLLQLILAGTDATAELAQQPGLGTTGQLHHHLRALAAGGWLRSPSRGRHEVPPNRVVPLLAILLAAEPN